MADISFESDVGRLRAENSHLREEVAQLQSDKEFVWSLWKRLQVASPDLTQAIADVVRREKEKAEIKDRKVMDILKLKDSQIASLQEIVAERESELKSSMLKQDNLQALVRRLEIDYQQLQDKSSFQQDKLRSRDNKERTVDELNRQLIEGFEKDKAESQRQLSEKRSEICVLRAENADLSAVKIMHESKVKNLLQDLSEAREQYEKLFGEFEEAKRKVYQHDIEVRQLELEVDHKRTESVGLKRELDELWSTHDQCKQHAAEQASVIRQLQSLQKDTQHMLTKQTDNQSFEYQSLHTLYNEMERKMTAMKNVENQQSKELKELKRTLLVKEEKIDELQTGVNRERNVKIQTQLDDVSTQVSSSVMEYEYKLNSVTAERDLLKERLREKAKLLRSLQKETSIDVGLDLTPVKLCSPSNLHRFSVKDAPLQVRYDALEKRYKNAQQLLKLKANELDELRASHTKRLERLKRVQSNYDLVKKQLESYDKDLYRSRDDGMVTKKRSEAKSLRHEDTDAVWNELTHYKQENIALLAERMDLEEKLDLVSVQNIQAAATIHELKINLEATREEKKAAESELEIIQTPQRNMNQQLTSTKHELMGKEAMIESLAKERSELHRAIENSEKERRKLRAELNESLRELAEKRIEMCDVRAQLQKLQKSCRKLKRTKASLTTHRPSARRIVIDKRNRVVKWEEGDDEADVINEAEDEQITDSADEYVEIYPSKRIRRHDQETMTSPYRDATYVEKQMASERMRVCTREAATSPYRFNDRARTNMSNGLRQQLKNARYRLVVLQDQLKTARQAKLILEKSNEEQKLVLEHLQRDLLSANQRLKTSRVNHQKLLSEHEELLTERDVLAGKSRDSALIINSKQIIASTPQDLELDRKLMESRLRQSACEVSRQSVQIKALRSEIEEKDTKIMELSEKVQRLDRDTSQKRVLLDDGRLRLKIAQEQNQIGQSAIEELNSQIRLLNQTVDKQKVNVESAKKRVTVALKEKREYEALYQQTTEKLADAKFELEKTGKALIDFKVRCSGMEREMNDVEEAAHAQMHETVRKSEAAIDVIEGRLQRVEKRLASYRHLIECLCERLVRSTQNARTLVHGALVANRNNRRRPEPGQRQRESALALEKAGHVARSILNLNEDELEDLMNSEHEQQEPTVEVNNNHDGDVNWMKKWQKILRNERGDFEVNLVDVLMEKVDEQFKLFSQLLVLT